MKGDNTRHTRREGAPRGGTSARSRWVAIGTGLVAAAAAAWLFSAGSGDTGTIASVFAQTKARTDTAAPAPAEPGEAKEDGEEVSGADSVVPPLVAAPDPNRPKRLPEGAKPEAPASFECRPGRNDPDAPQHARSLAPFSKDMYPCTACHDKPEDINARKRNLTLNHLDIELEHGPQTQWCYDCHSPSRRDMLQTAGDRLIPFEQSYELCGQCHGSRLKDWKLGIHGRRTGCWNGEREYLVCVHCHDPHAPKFKALNPKPPPVMPSEIRLGSTKTEAKP